MKCRPFTASLVGVLLAIMFFSLSVETSVAASKLEPALRRPVAIVATDELLYTANRAGTISVIDLESLRVKNEIKIASQLTDLALLESGDLLVTDGESNELLYLRPDGTKLKITNRLKTAMGPTSIAILPGGRTAVALLWAQQLMIAETRATGLKSVATIDLPFAPQTQTLAGDKLVVAAAFGGELCVIDTNSYKITARRTIEGHNIRGLHISHAGDELLAAHQILNSRTYTTRSRVFWGNMMGNVLRSIPLAELISDDSTADTFKPIGHWSLHPLGRPGAAAGDPSTALVTSDGRAAVAFAGVNQIALRQTPNKYFDRIDVGARPMAMATDRKEQRLFVANMFDDSISVIDMPSAKVVNTISLGPEQKLTAIERGERLFYDASLSLDGWMSCHSCHTEGHSNGLLNDNFGDDSFGAPKRVLSLLGGGHANPWAWTGSQTRLEDQIEKSIAITMQGKEAGSVKKENFADLAAYLQTLQPPPGISRARGESVAHEIERGRKVFEKYECNTCHVPPDYTSDDVYDVGIEDDYGVREFNPPSLRGVSQRSHLLHDNRATSLRELFEKHQHPRQTSMEPTELELLLSFLRSL